MRTDVGIERDVVQMLRAGASVTDTEIARAAVEAIRDEMPAVSENIRVLVHHGHVVLEGQIEWNYLKRLAEQSVHRLRGVTGITNSISVRPAVKAGAIKQRIEDSFRRRAQMDADRIIVEARGGEVTLRGTVRSSSEREEAQQAAASAPGVIRIRNDIRVGDDAADATPHRAASHHRLI